MDRARETPGLTGSVNAAPLPDVEQGMSLARRSRRPHMLVVCLIAVVSVLCGVLPGASAQGADGPGGSGAESDDVDVLTATREEVRRALADLDQRYATQRSAVEQAEDAARAASDEVERAEARIALADHEVAQARDAVAEFAVEAYIRPPAQDELRVLSITDADDASYASNVLQILTAERYVVVETLVDKQRQAARAREKAVEAADAARDAANAAQVELVELDRMRAQQRDLAASLDERLDKALAEAAALAEIDRGIAEELAAQELELRSAGPESAPTAVLTSTTEQPAPAPTPAPAPAPAPSTTRPPTTRPAGPTPTTRPPTTRPPATTTPPGGLVTWNDVVRVGGIWVNTSIAADVRQLLNAATAAGLSLAGGGYRDPQAQIDTRRANCGPTYYDIYEKPSSQCRPPTARPGRSMHEKGLAIDFTSNGSLITSRSNPAFVWLSNNAARYGLYNLPSEPWHWSTNGN